MASQPIVLEIDKLRTTSGTVLNLDSLLPSAITPTGSVLTWTSSGFANDSTFAEITYVDGLHNAVIGGATTASDTLGKAEGLINQNTTDIGTTQSDLLNKANSPSADSLADEVLRFVGGNLVNDNTFATKSYVTTEVTTAKNDILGGAAPAYDTLLEIQNELQSNDTDISNILTTMSTKAPVPAVDTGATEVLAWRSGGWVNDTTFAQTSYVDGEITGVIGGASTTHDTLGKIEGVVSSIDSAYQAADSNLQTQINTNTSDISSLQSDVSANTLNTNTNTTNLNAEISDRQNADAAIIGGASSSADTLGKIEWLLSTKAPEPPNGIAAGEFLRWDETNKVFTFATPAGGGSSLAVPPSQTSTNTFLYYDGISWQYGTPSVASGAGTTVTSGVVQAVNNTMSGGEALSVSGYSSKGYASITTQLVNSMVLFMTSGTPQVNGEAHMSVHWRYRDTPSSAWSTYQDTGKILMRIAESYTLSEPREGAIAIHAPMRPAGAEIEYRVYFHIVAGTIYYPDNSVVSQLTNMTLMEVAI